LKKHPLKNCRPSERLYQHSVLDPKRKATISRAKDNNDRKLGLTLEIRLFLE